MSYDLILHRQLPSNHSRGSETRPSRGPNEVSPARALLVPTAAGLATAAVLVLLLGKTGKVQRTVEKKYYRATRRDLGRTQETPAVTMRELVYGREEES